MADLENILNEFMNKACDYEAGLKVDLDKSFEEASAKINRLIVEAELNILQGILNRDMFKNPDPTEGQIKLKQSIEQDILALSNNLSKGKDE